MGRPQTLDVSKVHEVVERCKEIPLFKACMEIGVPRTTVADYIKKNEDLSAVYARNCIQRHEFLADELLEIADSESIPSDQKRVMVDTRKWMLSKMIPKVYGDKVQTEASGEVVVRVVRDALPQPSELAIEAEFEDISNS